MLFFLIKVLYHCVSRDYDIPSSLVSYQEWVGYSFQYKVAESLGLLKFIIMESIHRVDKQNYKY